MNARDMEWGEIPRFSPEEWPEGVLEHMSPRIIHTLSAIRHALPASHVITPSPIARAHVRHEEGGSRHCTNGRDRLSDATDVFMEWPHVWAAWIAAQRVMRVGGLGLYTDMVWAGQQGRKAMLHIDTRPERLVWVAWRKDRESPMHYVYENTDPIGFHRIIAERART